MPYPYPNQVKKYLDCNIYLESICNQIYGNDFAPMQPKLILKKEKDLKLKYIF